MLSIHRQTDEQTYTQRHTNRQRDTNPSQKTEDSDRSQEMKDSPSSLVKSAKAKG